VHNKHASIDRLLAILIALLVIGGCFIFASAAFGLLARGQSNISSVIFNHLVLGVGLGLVLLIGATAIDYRFWRRFAPHLFVVALVATALVFVPHIGLEHGGGKRWVVIFGQSFQPSELLKIATIIMAAAYFAAHRGKINTWHYGLGGLVGILALPALLLVLQPDLGTLSIICIPVCAIYLVAGAPWRDIGILVGTMLVIGAILVTFMPHARARIMTFIDPASNQQGSSYQIHQSLIAVGSGGIFGRGLGQGVQKFTYLPEPMGDSIFAVAAEELGLIGSLAIIFTFLAFVLRGLRVGAQAIDPFGTYVAIGISVYLAGEAFINIGAMLGVTPLTGVPLTFVSQGGSAMLMSLAAAGILLAVSRGRKRPTGTPKTKGE
jgi:cell division protein FtsW